MQGKPRSQKSDDLPYIFFKIRESRCPKTRRSWQRRARIALASRADLTEAERHEICCVWSKSNAGQIDSPAMSKLQGKEHRPQPHQTISARSCTRRRFDAPSADYSVSRRGQPVAAAPHHQVNCTPQNALFAPVTLHFQGYIYQRSRRGSDEPDFLNDSHADLSRRRALERSRCKKRQKRRLKKRFSKA